MGTIWEWRDRQGGAWEALSSKKPETWWLQKEYREIEVGEPRFDYVKRAEGWPHRFDLSTAFGATYTRKRVLCETVYAWCTENFGDTWSGSAGSFVFQDDADALAFRLRWC